MEPAIRKMAFPDLLAHDMRWKLAPRQAARAGGIMSL